MNDEYVVFHNRLSFEETHVLVVDASVEYILEFTPVSLIGCELCN